MREYMNYAEIGANILANQPILNRFWATSTLGSGLVDSPYWTPLRGAWGGRMGLFGAVLNRVTGDNFFCQIEK